MTQASAASCRLSIRVGRTQGGLPNALRWFRLAVTSGMASLWVVSRASCTASHVSSKWSCSLSRPH